MNPEKKKSAIRYWERRRIAYNLLLVPPALLGWGLAGSSAASGYEEGIGFIGVLSLFLVSAVGANIFYSFAYVFEFLFLSESENAYWPKPGRTIVSICGCLLAFILALLDGKNIAFIQYSYLK